MSLQVVVTDRNSVVVSAPGPQGPQGAAGSGSGSGTVTSITAGTGLSGGTITTSGTIAVSYGTTASTACEGNDSRLSDARTPTTHSHVAADIGSVLGPGLVGRSSASSGACERIGLGTGLEIDGSKNLSLSTTPAAQSISLTAGTGLTGGGDLSANRSFAVSFGSTSTTACVGNDSRLSDARTPTSHTHTLSELSQSSATTGQVPTWNGSAWAAASPASGGGTDPLDADVVAWHAMTQHPRWSSTVIGTGAAVGFTDSDSAAGVWRVETGAQAVANRRASYTGGSHRLDAVTSSEFVASCSMSANFSGTNTGWAAIGWIDSNANSASESTDGAFWRATDGGNWYAVTRSNGSETATDSGTASGSSFVRLRVVVSEISSTWTATFYLGGSLVATHTTNVPTGAGRHTGQGIMLNRTAATASNCALDVDYVYTRIDYASSMVVT
jgi:hypothetical protein